MFYDKVISKGEFWSWLVSSKNKFIIATLSFSKNASSSVLKKFVNKASNNTDMVGKTYPFLYAYWEKNKKASNRSFFKIGDYYSLEDHKINGKTASKTKVFINDVSKIFDGYERPQEITTIIASDIYGSGCFGLYHDVKLFAKDGQSISFKNDSSSSSNSFTYQRIPQVDHITTDNFKVG